MQEYRENDILREISKKSRKVRKRKPHRMKIAWKRVLSVVVVIAIVLCLMPLTGTQSAQAAIYRSIYLGTSGVQGYGGGSEYDTFYFGTNGGTPISWKVLDTKANGSVASNHALFMISDIEQSHMKFSDSGLKYQWASSKPKQFAQSLLADNFTNLERQAVLATSKTIDEQEKIYSSASELNQDYLFLLSRSEITDSKYGFDTAGNRPHTWTRSGFIDKDNVGKAYLAVVGGAVTSLTVNNTETTSRFAMNLNGDVSSILFTSGAKNTSINSGDEIQSTTITDRNKEWKTTLLDPSISLTIPSGGVTYNKGDGTVTVSGLTMNTGLVCSAMITDGAYGAEGSTLAYYSSLPTGGNFSFKIPTNLDLTRYHLYFVPEKRGDGWKADYAGHPVEIDVNANTVYTINATVNPAIGGTVTPSVTVKRGENATLTATPAVGYRFVGWTKLGETGYASTTPSYTITNVNANATYTAKFEPGSYQISINAAPEVGGFVTGGGTVPAGGSTTLIATPEEGYSFAGWYLDGELKSSNSSLTLNGVDADVSYTAVFNKSKINISVSLFPIGAGVTSFGSVTVTDDKFSSIGTNATTSISTTPGTQLTMNAFNKTATDYNFVGLYRDGNLQAQTTNADNGKYGKHWYAEEKYRGDGYSVTMNEDADFYIRMKLSSNKADYTMGVATVARPANAGVTSGNKNDNMAFDTTLGAVANPGYVFDHWEWVKDGVTYSSTTQSLKVTCTGYQVYAAVFRKATYDVVATPSPIDGGAVSGLGTYEYGTTANVKATPANGYTFSKWTWKDAKGDSHESTDQNLAIENIQASYNLTAVFKKTNHNVTVSATPVGTDYVNKASVTVGTSINETTATLTSVTSTVADGGSAVLKATPYTAGSATDMYQFKQWVANDGKVYTDNPLTVTNITEDKSYVAVFEKQKYKVTVESSPATGGTVDFDDWTTGETLQTGGTREYSPAITVVLEPHAVTAQGWKFYRFEGSDGSYYYTDNTGKAYIYYVHADVTYKAIFIKEKVTITTNVTPAGKGTVKLQDASGAEVTDGKITGNTAATLTATPGTSGNYKFIRWQDSSGKTYTDNPLYLANVIKDETYTAVFGEPQYTITTVATPIEGGTVSGGREYAAGEEAKLYARTKTGYKFDHWSCSDGSSSYGEEVTDPDDPSKTANLLTITSVNGSATYTAHFVKENVTITINWTPTDYVNSDAYGYEIYYTKDGVDQGRLPTTKKFEMSSSGSATVRIVPKTGYKVKQWLDESNKSLGDGILTLVNVKTDSVYTAEMEKGQYKITAQSSPIDGGVAKVGLEGQTGTIGYINVDAGANVELTATPSTGYMFDHWSASDGTTASGTTDTNTGMNTLKISGVYGDETYTAHYIKNTVQIAAYTSPSNIGSKIEYYVPGLIPEDLTDKVKTNHGAKVTFTLTATPGTGYKFKQWTMSDNTTSTSNPLTVSNITKDMTYYAEFEVEGYTIKTVATPVDGGQVTGGSGNVKIAPGSSVTLRAIPETGFKFDYWSCDDGSVAAGTEDVANPGQFTLNIAHVYGDATYTAHFIKDAVSLTVDMNEPTVNKVIGSIGGSTSPHEFPTQGSVWDGIASGSTVTLTPVPGSGYKFKEWAKSGTTTPISTNPLIIANIKEAANYYAVFEIEAFKITTKSSPAEGGSISGNSGGASSGGSVTLTATAASGYVFTEWVDDTGATYKSNPLTYGPIYSDVTLTAKFKKSDDALTVLASPASGGHVTKNLNADGSVTIVATANKGYIYQEWRKGDTVLTTATSYVVSNIKEKATYTAYFKVDPNYSAKSGITDEKFLDARRLFSAPNYKTTRDTIKAFASTFVSALGPQYVPKEHVTRSAVAAAGARFETSSSGLSDADYEAALADHEMISTQNEIMRVYTVEDSGAYLEKAKELTATKFGDQYSTELLVLKDVTPPADGEWVDGTRTLLWQKTGAQYKDNIYIIWEQAGYQQKVITPIADLQGVLKFSVPQMGTPDTRTRMCVVRVKIQ